MPFDEQVRNRLAADFDKADIEMRIDAGARALYATDASNYRQVPIAVAVPRSQQQLIDGIAICRRYELPVLCRGGGTSLGGQCCNVAVIFDVSKYLNRILEIDARARTARVEPGVVLDDLRRRTEEYGLTFAPDPATHNHATLGGMIGNNSCGVHSVMGGRTADNVHKLKIVTYDGVQMEVGETSEAEFERILRKGGRRQEIYAGLQRIGQVYGEQILERYPDIPRRVSGYNLDELLPHRKFNIARALVGSEGTCVTVLEATLRLVPSPPCRSLLVLGFDDILAAAAAVPAVMHQLPVGLEGVDHMLIDDARRHGLAAHGIARLPDGCGWLLAEFGGDTEKEAKEKAGEAVSALGEKTGVVDSVVFGESESKKVWEVRENALGATAHNDPAADAAPGWEDASVPPESLADYLRDFKGLLDEYGLSADLYGHFGDACIHTRINFRLQDADGQRQFADFIDDAADIVLRYGGSFSGEHGDGQARGQLLEKMFGGELIGAFRDFKALWDPDGKMNPGKVVDADSPTQHLRLAKPLAAPDTAYAYESDQGDFGWAMRRCVGVGECRKTGSGTMCPSYMVTREEKHSTRGRARLLYEMLVGDVLDDLWKSDAVREALDLCLECKACKSECPVRVDMAKYKAEFMSHHYAGRLRPRAAYAFGMIDRWSAFGSRFPALSNGMMKNRVFGALARSAANIAAERELPHFASPTFFQWWQQHKPADGVRKGRLILWPDTFNNYLTPQVAKAAVAVLERLGYELVVPEPGCCGRPSYGFGMLGRARRLGGESLDKLYAQGLQDLPVVVLEPTCASALVDDLPDLLPRDERAQDLKTRLHFFNDFVAREPLNDSFEVTTPIVAAPHCHQRALFDLDAQESAFRSLGAPYRLLDSGCCGMAGPFGFERDKYELSVQLAERVLLPEVRAMDPASAVMSEGYACREQIRQQSGRQASHMAEILQRSMRTE